MENEFLPTASVPHTGETYRRYVRREIIPNPVRLRAAPEDEIRELIDFLNGVTKRVSHPGADAFPDKDILIEEVQHWFDQRYHPFPPPPPRYIRRTR